MDGMTPTIFEVAEQAARKRHARRAGKKPSKPRAATRRKQAERGSGRVRKSGGRSKRKTGR